MSTCLATSVPLSKFQDNGCQMFDEADIRSHIASTFGRGGVANYSRVDEYGARDASGAGIEGHKAKFRRETDARLSLRDVARGAYRSRLRWTKEG